MMKRWMARALISFIILGIATVSLATTEVAPKIRVFVSIQPQAYFVERVGGPYVDVHVLVGPGQSPATYEPTPKQMARLGHSQVYFRIGTPFERSFIDRISKTFKNVTIVDTRRGISLRHFSHSEGISVPDPHIWLDPQAVKIQAQTIYEALSRIAPSLRAEFGRNLAKFQDDLTVLDAEITEALAPLKGGNFYVFHPAFGYFGDRYGLIQVTVEIEGKEPSPKQLTALIKKAKKDNVKVLFVQPQFAQRNAEAIARALGGAVVPMNPLPRDYLNDMEKMAELIKKALNDSSTTKNKKRREDMDAWKAR